VVKLCNVNRSGPVVLDTL